MVVTRRVLVTRPQPGADATAERLRETGFSPMLLPLTRIEPFKSELTADPAGVDAVAITSVNAVRYAPSALLDALKSKPVFAVGEASAMAAREAGFGNVRSAAGTAPELAAMIARECRPGSSVLHPAGVERTAGFAEALESSGFTVATIEVYDAKEVSYPTDFIQHVADEGPIWGALVMSPRAGALLARLSARPHMTEAFEKTTFFCISRNAATPFSGVEAGRVFVSDAPSEDSLLRLLSSQV